MTECFIHRLGFQRSSAEGPSLNAAHRPQKRKALFNRKSLALCPILFAGIGIAPAFAGTATSNLSVTATATASCSINAGALALNYDPVVANQSTASTSTATLTVACTSGSASTITLGQGTNAASGSTDAAPQHRALNGTANYLNYGLYSDAAYQTLWGNTSATGAAYTGTGTTGTVTVYASIPATTQLFSKKGFAFGVPPRKRTDLA